jgi:hypothetical protein
MSTIEREESNVARNQFYLLSEPMPNTLGGVCFYIDNVPKKYLYKQYRGFGKEPFNQREMCSFMSVVLVQFLGIKVQNMKDYTRAEPQIISYNLIPKTNNDSFTNISFQHIEHNKKTKQLQFCDYTIKNATPINRIKHNDDFILQCQCTYTIKEIILKLDMVNFIKYVDKRFGDGVSNVLSKIIQLSFDAVTNLTYNIRVFTSYTEFIENILPSQEDYITYQDILNYISTRETLVFLKKYKLARKDLIQSRDLNLKLVTDDGVYRPTAKNAKRQRQS